MKLFARGNPGKKGNVLSLLSRFGWKAGVLLGIGGAVFAVILFYASWAATFDMKKVGQMPERNTVFDVDGKIYSRLAGANRLRISLNEVPPTP